MAYLRLGGKRTKRIKDEFVLDRVRETIAADESSLYTTHAEWMENILFVRGLQHMNFGLEQGRILPYPDVAHRVRVTYNVTLPIVEGMKSALLTSNPRFTAIPMGDDDEVVEAAQFASVLMDWAVAQHELEEMRIPLIDDLVETGNGFMAPMWDPRGGVADEDDEGNIVYSGNPIVRVVSPFAIGMHPHARSIYESPYVRETDFAPKEWAIAAYPECEDDLASMSLTSGGGDMLEFQLMNLTMAHGRQIGGISELSSERSFFRRTHYFEPPCPKYPKGFMAVLAGDGQFPSKVLKWFPTNPYRKSPYVHFRLLTIPNRPFGWSLIPSMKPPQRELNRRRGQIIENANLFANPRLWISDKIDEEQEGLQGNEAGQLCVHPDGIQHLPQYDRPPELPQHVFESHNSALELINFISQPFGPMADSDAAGAESGYQLAQLDDIRNRKLQPMLQRVGFGFKRFWKQYLDNWHSFQKLPRGISALMPDGELRVASFHKAMALDRVALNLVPGSLQQYGRAAMIGLWTEIGKAGIVNFAAEPEMKRLALESVLTGNSTRTDRTLKAQWEKARRNVAMIRSGLHEQVYPDIVDDADVHMAVYAEFMLSERYHKWRAANPEPDEALRSMLAYFQGIKAKQLAAIAAGQQQGGGSQGGPRAQGNRGAAGGPAQAKSISQGNPSGGSAARSGQGFGRDVRGGEE